ncbi:MAG: carboxypeptidase regulatory-like domain-containing protein [Bacteroidota bacterium]
MKYTTIFLFAMLSLSLSFCSSIQQGYSTIKQGVFGQALWSQGNQMPSPDKPQQNGSRPVQRTVYIYMRTKLKEAVGQPPLFSKIETKLVAKVKTNKEGYFQCKLEPGYYSAFTEEADGRLFANLFDGDGNIAAFEVKAGKLTTYPIHINYKAAY